MKKNTRLFHVVVHGGLLCCKFNLVSCLERVGTKQFYSICLGQLGECHDEGVGD